MKNKKCIVCSKVKGKRVCQLNNSALICPHCCGETRNNNCEGCRYYAQSEQHAMAKTKKPKFKKSKHSAMRLDPQVDQSVDQALTMVESGDLQAGEAIVSDLFKKHPDIATVQYARGVICAIKGQYDESIAYFDKAIDIFPYFVEAWFNQAISYQKKVEPVEAIRAFQKVVELGNPDNDFVRQAKELIASIEKQIYNELGITLGLYLKSKNQFDEASVALKKGEWEKALTGFQAVVSMNPKHPQSYGNMGICYGQLGRKQEALAAFDKALELDPKYEPARLNRAVIDSQEEGKTLQNIKSVPVEDYKQQQLKKKSLLGRFFDFFKPKAKK